MKTPILEMKHIRKTFASTIALGDVSFDVYSGEIRGLIGENGSGKSTVCSIAAGMQKADSGGMLFHGQPWKPESTLDALERGIGMIVQESGTISGITVAENLYLGEMKQFCGKLGAVNRKRLFAEADKALRALGIAGISGKTPMAALDFQARKLVEIAKVARKDPEILVVDETTTALSQEVRNPSMTAFGGNWYFSFALILVTLAEIVWLFDYSRFGYDYKALQAGQKVAVNTGIREVPNALACYGICGVLMGMVGFLSAVRSSNINGGSLNFGSIGIMFTAFLPMFIGGYIGKFSNDKLGHPDGRSGNYPGKGSPKAAAPFSGKVPSGLSECHPEGAFSRKSNSAGLEDAV